MSYSYASSCRHPLQGIARLAPVDERLIMFRQLFVDRRDVGSPGFKRHSTLGYGSLPIIGNVSLVHFRSPDHSGSAMSLSRRLPHGVRR